MFESIRRNQRVLQFLLLLFIFPAFAFFGLSGYDTMFSNDDAVATVGESPISAVEYDNARRAQIDNMRRVLGDRFDPSMLDSPAAREQILEGLVTQRVLAVEAQEHLLSVPDAAIVRTIQNIPGVKNADGQFDIELYRNWLNARGRSEDQFERQLRSDLALQIIPQSLSQTAFMSKQVARRLMKLTAQQRKVKIKRFKPEDYLAQIDVDSAKAREFYDKNKEDFKSAETAKVNFLVLSQAELAKNVDVSADEIKKRYEVEGARFMQQEQRQARHIMIAVEESDSKTAAKEKAEGLLKELHDGADFAVLAKEHSHDVGTASQGGDLGLFTRQSIDPAIADAAYALELNAISDVVESEFGFHIIQLSDIRAAQQEPLEKVKDRLEASIRVAKSRQAYLEAAEGFSNTVYEEPDSLEAAADASGLTIQTLDALGRFGSSELAPDSPIVSPRVLRAVFSANAIADKQNIEAIDLGNNVMVSARVLSHNPSKIQAFEQVEADAISRLRATLANEKAKIAGEAELAKLKAGAELSGFGDELSVTRTGSRDLGAQSLAALFSASSTSLPSFIGVPLAGQGYEIQQFVAVTEIEKKTLDDGLQQFMNQYATALGQQSLDSYLVSLKARTEIVRSLPRTGSSESDQ